MRGVYNDAILYNQELMTPSNAKLFHQQFQRLMERSLEFVRQKSDLQRQQEELDRQRRKKRSTVPRRHLVAFLMTPFAKDFDRPREALRRVVEERLGCELRTADELTFEDFIRGNVLAHIEDADFFVADVTGANPNVMLELGAVLYGRAGEPTVLIAGVPAAGDKPDLPADLAGHIAGLYVCGDEVGAIADALKDSFRKHARLKAMLDGEKRETFLSAVTLRQYTRDLLKSAGIYDRLAERYPTASAWRSAHEGDLAALLADESDLAITVIKRVTEKLG
jgi:hypothetical protein